MPKSSQPSVENEGRILLAIKAFKNGEISNIHQAALTFKVPDSTLRRRIQGTPCRVGLRANSHKLTETEENTLLNWIISLDDRGSAPRPAQVENIANLMLAARGDDPPLKVGQKWVYNFVQRSSDIKTRFSKRYNYERALNEDPKIIQEWFDQLEKTIFENGIVSDDIYNFDETGFAMGLTSTAKVITRAEYYGRREKLQPGNREWVTAIECIGATGFSLPPCLIFKGKVHIESWFSSDVPRDWRLEVSPNGWTSDEIGLRWLQKVFIPATSNTKGKYRLLVLDGHGSHLTPKFDQICSENNIIPICMPSHSSHLLQPLDVGCFAVLKRAYSQLVLSKMEFGYNHIDKLDFLEIYPSARKEAFKTDTTISAFAATGIIPLDSDRVISKLTIRLRTPTPLPSSQQSDSSRNYSPRTPSSQKDLRRQHKALLSLDPSSTGPSKRALRQLIKSGEKLFQQNAILAAEIKIHRAAAEKKKQKRKRSRGQMICAENITNGEGLDVVQQGRQSLVAQEDQGAEQGAISLQARPRQQRGCGICRIPGHRRETCPQRPQ